MIRGSDQVSDRDATAIPNRNTIASKIDKPNLSGNSKLHEDFKTAIQTAVQTRKMP